MSQSPQKRKFEAKKYFANNKRTRNNFLEAGQRGFLATCNFREKDCVREAYNILNEFYNKLNETTETNVDKDSEAEKSDDIDIQDEVDQLANAARDTKSLKEKRFQSVTTDTMNCIFIKTTVENPMELGLEIFKELFETKQQKTRFLIRLTPVQEVCKANLKSIVDTIGKLWDIHILNNKLTYKSFSIVFNKRLNNSVNRDEVLQEVADLVKLKCPLIKVDLSGSEVCVIIEVIKGHACICIGPDYFKYKKYNLVEICKEVKTENGTDKQEISQNIEKHEIDSQVNKADTIQSADAKNENE